MGCLMSCGGCAIGTAQSDADFENALDAPVPEHCPQVMFDPGAFTRDASGSTCARCGRELDEDGRCGSCSMQEWIEDDIKAKRDKPVVDDSVSHGPEY